MRKLISSFLVTFFSPAGLFPTAGLAKQRKKHTSTSSPGSSRFPIWRWQGNGSLLSCRRHIRKREDPGDEVEHTSELKLCSFHVSRFILWFWEQC